MPDKEIKEEVEALSNLQKRPTKPSKFIDYSHNKLQIVSDKLPKDFIIKTMFPVMLFSSALAAFWFYLAGAFRF